MLPIDESHSASKYIHWNKHFNKIHKLLLTHLQKLPAPTRHPRRRTNDFAQRRTAPHAGRIPEEPSEDRGVNCEDLWEVDEVVLGVLEYKSVIYSYIITRYNFTHSEFNHTTSAIPEAEFS